LLTQSGGDDPVGDNGGTTVGNYPELVIGRTYYIADNFQLECDFTNVGAPNNNIGTYFVATGTTPASWGTYGYLQYNTGAPVVTVLENTIGNIWWTYVSDGSYYCNSSGLFTIGKTFSNIEPSAVDVENYRNAVIDHYSTISISNFINIITGDFISQTPSNNYLNSTPIEIRVYN
jgi:hypothetical protein